MKRRLTRGVVAAAVAALVFGLLPGATAQAAHHARFQPVTVLRNGVVDVHKLPRHTPPGLHKAHKRDVHLNGVANPGPPSAVPTAVSSAQVATGSTQEVLSRFEAVGLDLQVARLSSDQFVTPPDPQIAAGPTQLVEMVNSSGSIWDKQGTLLSIFDLNKFFLVPTGYSFSDPRVLFDRDSQRWFASGVAFIPPTYASVVVLAVSSSVDATGTWVQYTAANSSTLTHDQPKIGVSSDKVVISWNDFLLAAYFQGQSTWILQKSQMVAGSTAVNGAALGPDGSRSSLVPAVQLTSNSDAFVVFNGTDCAALGGNCGSTLGVVRISGTPLQGNLAWNESDPIIGGTSVPPAADQPGMPASIATNDDRFLTAVWNNGVLWTGGNDACLPSGDTAARPCARLVQVLTAGPTVTQNFDIASSGAGLYYPTFAMDASGDMYVAYNISSSTQFIGVRITGQLAAAPVQTIAAAQTIRAGDTTYDMNPCFGTSSTSRWGDYQGAALDPQNPTDAWVVGQYAAIGSTAGGDNGCDWATYAARLTFSAPAVTAIAPNVEQAGGSTVVAVTGSDFTPDAVVHFGSSAATAVSVQSPDQLSATAPSGCGTVDVTVTTADGTSATSAADQFTYLTTCGGGGSTLTSISPNSGPAAGGTSITFTGSGFDIATGTTQFMFGSSLATGVTCSSSTTCTGTSPAGTGTVPVTATVHGIPATGSATFTYITPLASLSGISPATGPAAGGASVTFTGSGFGVTAGQTQFRFGSSLATGVSCSTSTACTGISPAGVGAVSVTVTVDAVAGTGSPTFTYIASLSAISPSTGPATGGTLVTFTGLGFDVAAGKTQFKFGAGLATSVSCSSTTTCTGRSPAGAGKAVVTVTVDGSAGTGSATFTYIPSMSSISPTAGPAAGGTRVTITGTGFDVAAGATQFKFGGRLATNVTCSSSTTCTAVTPPGSGTVSVVAIVDGQQSSNSLSFRYRRR